MTPTEQLSVTRDVDAAPDRVFQAWTEPEQIVRWWGGAGVSCPAAEVDLRPGGIYRIANAGPDGAITWISGEFQIVDPPSRLVYTWSVEPPGTGGPPPTNRSASVVEVDFVSIGSGTRITVRQTRIPSAEARELFLAGWIGCLDGLADLLAT